MHWSKCVYCIWIFTHTRTQAQAQSHFRLLVCNKWFFSKAMAVCVSILLDSPFTFISGISLNLSHFPVHILLLFLLSLSLFLLIIYNQNQFTIMVIKWHIANHVNLAMHNANEETYNYCMPQCRQNYIFKLQFIFLCVCVFDELEWLLLSIEVNLFFGFWPI